MKRPDPKAAAVSLARGVGASLAKPLKRAKGGDVLSPEEREKNLSRFMKGVHPLVPRVLHTGTTGDFIAFDPRRANIESNLGAGIYASNSKEDVAANYAGEGPDLTNRIERKVDEFRDSDEWHTEDELRDIARKELNVHHKGLTMPIHMALKNPVVLGGQHETFYGYSQPYDEERDEYGEPQGAGVKLHDALRSAAKEFDVHPDEISKTTQKLFEHMADYSGIKASDVESIIKNGMQHAMDPDTGDSANAEILRKTFENLGHDGIVDTTVNRKFGTMRQGFGNAKVPGMTGVTPDTIHYVAFYRNQIKSAIGNDGTYDHPSDITKAEGGPVEDTLLDSTGKPVHHTPEGVENFKKWFGKSHVINGDGRPWVMNHLTASDFSEFKPGGDDPNLSGPAIWMTPQRENIPAAHNTGYRSRDTGEVDYRSGANVMPLYAKIENPLYIMDEDDLSDAQAKYQHLGAGFPTLFSQKAIDAMKKDGYDGVFWAAPNNREQSPDLEAREGVEVIAFDRSQIKSAIGNDGTWDHPTDITKAGGGEVESTLLDSTGKPVHHTPEGVENFKRWHEGSHVVDKQGRPLVVYHGTGGDFSKFQADLTGSRHRDLEVGGAFYFSDDKETANWYAESAGRQAKGGANVMPVYLRMTNPLVVEYGGADSQYLYEDIQKAKDLGHDGVLARNIDDGGVSTHFIAFDRSQIKSAIGNDGTWDHPSDITKARGGQVETVEGPEREQNLKNWLGDSLLHDNGVPRTYYHGTSKDKPFTSFNVGRHGAWFTSDPEDASSYAHQNDSMTSVYESGRFVDRNTASRVMPVYLKASNPFLGDRPEKYRNAENYKKAQSDWFDELRAAGYDSWIPQSEQGRLAVMLGGAHQIKSAIGNDGTFDHPSNIAKAEGGEVEPEGGPVLHTSVPNDEWLKSKQEHVASGGRHPSGAFKRFGSTTGYFRSGPEHEGRRNVMMPVPLLASIPGVMEEQKNVRQHALDWLTDEMGRTGRLPLNSSGEEYAPHVWVNHEGEAFVAEGNHRIMAAQKLGMTHLPVELEYVNGGERVNGPFHPDRILAMHREATSADREGKAEGGQVEGTLLNSAGKPVHHTPEGVEAFKQWFGDSKSVDEQSRPVVMYRGVAGNATQGINAGALNAEPRVKDWATFATTSPSMAATYAAPDFKWDEAGALVPVYVKADKLIEFPVRKTDYGNRHDKVKFDMEAARLSPGEVLVARNVIDTGPRSNEAYSVDKEMQYSYPADIYAWGPGTSVKSAVGNDGTWDHPTDITKAEGGEVDGQPPAQPAQPTPPARKFNSIGLYSHAAEQALKLPQTRGSLDQLLGALKNKGVKQDEIFHSGVEQQFDGRPSVTKQELADHFNANMPEFSPQTDTSRYKDWALQKDEENRQAGGELAGRNYREHLLRLTNPSSILPFRESHWPDVSNIVAHLRTQDFVRGKNKAEVPWEHPDLDTVVRVGDDRNTLLSILENRELRAKQTDIPGLIVHKPVKGVNEPHEYSLTHARSAITLLNALPYHAIRQFVDDIKPLGIDWSKPWSEIKSFPQDLINKITQTRHNWEQSYPNPKPAPAKRKGKAPKRTSALFLDEVQSDWGQKSRKRGIVGVDSDSDEWKKELEDLTERHRKAILQFQQDRDEFENVDETQEGGIEKLKAAGRKKEDSQNTEFILNRAVNRHKHTERTNPVPNGPYIDSTEKWTDLSLKYALKKAVDEGRSHLVWTPSKVQTGRSMSQARQMIDSFKVVHHASSGTFMIQPIKDHKAVHVNALNNEYLFPKEIEKILGKELTDLVTQNNPNNEIDYPLSFMSPLSRQYRYDLEDNVDIGKSGQEFMYDKLIPKRLLALARQHDPDAKLTTYQGEHEPIKGFPALEITPAMAKSIKENGFKAFKRGGAVGGVDHALRVARKARGMT